MIRDKREGLFKKFNGIFSNEDELFAYLAGVYEANGSIIVQNRNFKLNIYGNTHLLNEIRDFLEFTGLELPSPYFFLQLSGNTACKVLEKIYPYLIIKRKQTKLIFDFQEHINNTMDSTIDENEKIYRDKTLEMIKNANNSDEVNLDHVDKWIFNYFYGYFDSKAKINLKKEDGEYWLNIRLTSEFEYILLLFQQLFDLGYVYETRSSSRWELNYSDAYDLLIEIQHYLVMKIEEINTAIKFHRFFQETKKPLLDDDILFLENLIKERNNLDTSKKLPKNNFHVTIMICDELSKLIYNSIQNSINININSLFKEAIQYFKMDESKVLETMSSICINKLKYIPINIFLDRDIVEFLDTKSDNRSELLRNIIQNYLQNSYSSNEKEAYENLEKYKEIQNKNDERNPLKLLKKFRQE